MKKLLILAAISQMVVSCYPSRILTSATIDSVRVEVVVRTEFLEDTVYMDVPVEVERAFTTR